MFLENSAKIPRPTIDAGQLIKQSFLLGLNVVELAMGISK